MKGLFVTGTDTNVGKTYVSCLLAADLTSKNISVIPRKPVESGCKRLDNKLLPSDALKLKQSSQYTGTIEQVCKYAFEQAISPARAAKLSAQKVQLENLVTACQSDDISATDFLLVEGAGGFHSPICDDALNSDLAQQLNLPVLLVADDRLGCINHILLTLEAIAARDLTVCAIILNQLQPHSNDNLMNNLEELQQILKLPIITLAYGSTDISSRDITLI